MTGPRAGVRIDACQVARISGGPLGPCPERDQVLLSSEADWVFLHDADVEPQPGCVEALLEEGLLDERVGAVVPRVLRREDPALIHYDGGVAHYFGETAFVNHWTRVDAARPPHRRPGAASSAAVLVRREAALDAGLFWADIGFYREDLDFFLRLRLRGWRIAFLEDARVLHGGGPRGPLHATRARLQARNRWRIILSVLSARTFWVTLPLQLIHEVLSLGASLIRGQAAGHILGLTEAATGLPQTLARRRRLQRRRRVSDAELFEAPDLTPAADLRSRPLLSAATRLWSRLARAWWGLAPARPRRCAQRVAGKPN